MQTHTAAAVATLTDRQKTAQSLASVVGHLGIARTQLARAVQIIASTSDSQLIDLAERAVDSLAIVVELVEHEVGIYQAGAAS